MIKKIARMLDHSVLHPTATDADVLTHCEIAKRYSVASLCVKPYHVAYAYEQLCESSVPVSAVIGFPHGNSTIAIKTAEALQVITDGAREVDMVVNIGKVLQNDWTYIRSEIDAVQSVCVENNALLKVIFETDFVLSDMHKITLCSICNELRVAFAKTSTGFGFVKKSEHCFTCEGATAYNVSLMRTHCEPHVQIKASGGIRSLEQVLHMIDLGVTRIGTSATVTILEAIKNVENS